MPSSIRMTPRDKIHVSYYSSVVTTLYMTAYFYSEREKQVKDISLPDTITGSARAEQTLTWSPKENGELVGFDCFTNTAKRGQTYVLVSIRFHGNRGLGLIKGYVSTTYDLNWTAGFADFEDSVQGMGYRYQYYSASAGAVGSNWAFGPPTNTKWRVTQVKFVLTTDANVANRLVHIEVTDGTAVYWTSFPAPAQTASQTRTYLYSKDRTIDETAFDANGMIRLAMPEIWLSTVTTQQLRSLISNIQATDDTSSLQISVEEWIED